MWQRLKQLVVGMSIVLCVVTSVIWLRSYWRSDAIVYSGRQGHRGVQSLDGTLVVGFDNVGDPNPTLRVDSWSMEGMQLPVASGFWGRLGFASYRSAPQAAVIWRHVWLPLWFVVLCTLVVPSRAGFRWLRKRRRRHDKRCVDCGYDLRASTERCPECGSSIAHATQRVDENVR